jgi:hypothetical protein
VKVDLSSLMMCNLVYLHLDHHIPDNSILYTNCCDDLTSLKICTELRYITSCKYFVLVNSYFDKYGSLLNP